MPTMSRQNKIKINQLLREWPLGTVSVYPWLANKGFNRKLIERYKKSGWVSPVGRGAVKRLDDQPQWEGGIYALQEQLHLPVHIGGKTALQMSGYAHFLPMTNKGVVYLFKPIETRLPGWFQKYDWGRSVEIVGAKLFLGEKRLGLTEKKLGTFAVKVSSPERAILEDLYLVPQQESFEEAYYLMEGLRTLRPAMVQSLLESCNSIKAKRLFMYMADKSNQTWVKKLDLKKIDLGKGKRAVVKGGVFDKKYQITIPKNYYPETEEPSK